MGSSIGGLAHAEAPLFLKGFSDVLGANGLMIIGVDACQDKDKVYKAYHDKQGKTREFYLNGLAHANTLFGNDVFEVGKWDTVGAYDEAAGRHQAFYVPTTDTVVDGVCVKAGEKIFFEESYKYSRLQSTELWQSSGFVAREVFGNSTDNYRKLHLQPYSITRTSLRERQRQETASVKIDEVVVAFSSALIHRRLHSPFVPMPRLDFCRNSEKSSSD